jgi:tRNA pseudouridine55 synthase
MELPAILLIDKPTGMTSFDVIRELRKRTGVKKFGHAGTLDPAASGLMIIGVGPGTKQLTDYIKLDKEYLAEVLIGESRTTGDREGEVLEQVDVVDVTEAAIKTAVDQLVGTIRLPVRNVPECTHPSLQLPAPKPLRCLHSRFQSLP